MSSSETISNRDKSPLVPLARQKAITIVVAMMEAVLLVLVCLSPWAYGAVHPGFEFLVDAGIAVLLTLWGIRMLLEGRLRWKKSAVALCLAGLFLLGVWQRTPLPRPVLALLSPGAARCYEQLLPDQPETLLDGAAGSRAGPAPGSTLSLYPGARRREGSAPPLTADRLLAVLLVFAVVYNNLTSTGALLRLSIAVLINGFFLSLFALVQFFAAPRNTVYWQYPTMGWVFGPFINHNHFADYVNLCIGLGIGLLVSHEGRSAADRRYVSSFDSADKGGALMQLLHSPLALGICAALGFMVSAVAFSRSRGGLLALLGAAVICGVLGRLRLGRSFRFGSLLLVAGVVVALSAWFGVRLVKERVETFWSGEAFDSRVPLWLRSLPIVADFPIWGTGYGTFGYIEQKYRGDARDKAWFRHAHNDYLEILVEGGVLALGLTVLALAVVYRLGYRALARNRGRALAGLALGTLFAFTTLVLHSFGEFGVHIPAIALLATVICAHLCAWGGLRAVQDPSGDAGGAATDEDEYRLRLGGIAPVLGALTAAGLGVVLCAAGWKAHLVDRLEDAAIRAGDADADQLRARIACYTAAVSLAPEDAQLHYELGSAYARLAKLANAGDVPNRRSAPEQATLALREFLRARNACPLLSMAQLGIADYSNQLQSGDSAEDYLRRAKLLAPGQPKVWYLCGLREMMLRRPEDAYETWRHCLELSSDYLPQVLSHTNDLPADQLVEKVLPDSPDVLFAAALRRYPDADAIEQRRPFLEKALRLLDRSSAKREARELHIKALVHKALDQPDEAIQSYRELLSREPSQTSWRFEFALYLYDLRNLEEARRELTIVLNQNPNNGQARELQNEIVREQSHERRDDQKGR